MPGGHDTDDRDDDQHDPVHPAALTDNGLRLVHWIAPLFSLTLVWSKSRLSGKPELKGKVLIPFWCRGPHSVFMVWQVPGLYGILILDPDQRLAENMVSGKPLIVSRR